MTAYYNENDPRAAAWLRELIARNLIAPGIVDDRSILEVTPGDLRGFVQCHFFAGIGVWSHALRRAGWPDDRPVWTGSCPCQPFSAAGKGGGIADHRHLWPEFYRLIRECRPHTIFGEQVASKPGLAWLDIVSADVENAGYAIGAVDTCAAGVGAPHIRQRLYWVADALGQRRAREHALLRTEEGGRLGAGEVPETAGSSEAIGVANADHSGPQGRGLLGADRLGGGADQCPPRDTGVDGRMAHADGGDASPEGVQRGTEQRLVAGDGEVGGLADTTGGGRREERPDTGGVALGDREEGLSAGRVSGGGTGGMADPVDGAEQSGESRPALGVDAEGIGAVQAEYGPAGPTNGVWRAADWLLCRDGKWRPVEPGTFPLVNGAPARVGRLRGYGNAIVAGQAQAFIEAYLEIDP